VPLLAPPPIAVAWRPLALLGDASMLLWAVASVAVAVVAVAALARGGRASFTPVALLAAQVALTTLSGNFGALELAGLVAIWAWRDRPVLIGTILACLVAVKLTPVTLAIWLAATGRFRALVAFGGAGAVLFAISLLGAGVDSWREWVQVAGTAAPSPRAIASITGLSTFAVFAILMAATVAVGALRRDRLTFVVAVITGCLATPALYGETMGPLAAFGVVWVVRSGRHWGGWGRDRIGGRRNSPERLPSGDTSQR
jgi:hypothetical protein